MIHILPVMFYICLSVKMEKTTYLASLAVYKPPMSTTMHIINIQTYSKDRLTGSQGACRGGFPPMHIVVPPHRQLTGVFCRTTSLTSQYSICRTHACCRGALTKQPLYQPPKVACDCVIQSIHCMPLKTFKWYLYGGVLAQTMSKYCGKRPIE